VLAITIFVSDGRTDYYGENNYKVSNKSKYLPLEVSKEADINKFKIDLKAYQNGKTYYFTFYKGTAKSGVEKWAVYMKDMTCTYFDKAGNEILVENVTG
jgi:uncharacterized protein YbcV (DUF1398 family)